MNDEAIQTEDAPAESRRKRARVDWRSPWNNAHVPLRLYVSPWIKRRLHLACETTEEYLEERPRETP